jgi:hypothetical protein
VDSTHIVKIRPLGSPMSPISFTRRVGRSPEFPDFDSADQHARILAENAIAPARFIVEEKCTGTRRAEYQSDGTGKVTAIP